jgi:biopolymer transport protein ExbB
VRREAVLEEEKIMFSILKLGGPMVWICLACGLVAFVVFIERALHLHRARIRSEDFLKGIFNILRRGNDKEALTICEETPGPVAYLVKTAILHRQDPQKTIREAVEDVSLSEISRMERRLVVIATVAQIAPLLGLLGTVLGMAEMLIVLQQQGGLIQSADLVRPLMEALMATAAGLTVAIPCYVAFNMLVVKIDRIVLDMERTKSEIVAFLIGPVKEAEPNGK